MNMEYLKILKRYIHWMLYSELSAEFPVALLCNSHMN